jgi:hypothetical protein
MIRYKQKYLLNAGLDSISFELNESGTIRGRYGSGCVEGILNSSRLIGTYRNEKRSIEGLIEITFHEGGFNAKWKQGLEPGPMRGKWTGVLNDSKNNPM